MFNASEDPEKKTDTHPVESMLKQLLPAPSQLDERELFYQAGYAARHGSIAAGKIDTSVVSRSRNMLLSFSGGLLSGVAACWLLFVSWSSIATVPSGNSRDLLLVKEQSPKQLEGDEISNQSMASRPSTTFVNLDMDWDENAIRTMIYRGNRKVIWNERESALNDSTSVGIRGAAGSPMEKNNLDWRRRLSEEWPD